jgi:stage II sporulation protein R
MKVHGGYFFMKNRCIIFFLSVIIILTAFISFQKTDGAGASSALPVSEYLRIHVRANSNEENDQAVKYVVKDSIVELLTPIVEDCHSKAEARARLQENLPNIIAVANALLKQQGYGYGARATLRFEEFPTRVYSSLTLPAGAYEALVVELGEGKGDNWWCVVYPPLCFSSGRAVVGDVVYKSKIAEVFEKVFK